MILQSNLQITNQEPLQITRNGYALCSQRNPEREAKIWLQQWENYLVDELEIVVVGLGATHHIHLLAQKFSDILIHVIEPDVKLIEFYKQNSYTLNSQSETGVSFSRVHMLNEVSVTDLERFQLLPVLDFRPAWQGFESHYQDILIHLRGDNNNIKEICYHLAEEDQSQEAKIWRALRELVI